MKTTLLFWRIPSQYLSGLLGLAKAKTYFYSGMGSWDTAELPCIISFKLTCESSLKRVDANVEGKLSSVGDM